MPAKILLVAAARPNFMKIAPLWRALAARPDAFAPLLVHTGQHYDQNMSAVFFADLGLPAPDVHLGVGSGTHAEQTAGVMLRFEAACREHRPACVIVVGDVNATMAAAIAAKKLLLDVAHVEAGLRSGDRTMPEEINRVMADHVSDLLFAPTEMSARNLRAEGLPENRIHVTGNTIVDAVRENLEIAAGKGDVLGGLGLRKGGYILTTLHRQENVDSRERLANVLIGLERAGRETGLDVIWPMHPRARKNLETFGLTHPGNVRAITPLGFLEFLQLEGGAALALTDSGGVQEESCILGVPCVTLRDNTERPETVDVGANVVVGTEPSRIVEGVRAMLSRKGDWTCPLGENGAGGRIVNICLERTNQG